jgi:hypothetical protein
MIEAILDHLHDDKKSLRACSLVCKDWIHPARRLLFSRWTIDLHRAEIDWSLRISAVLPFLRHICISSGGGTCTQDWDINPPFLVGQNLNHVRSLHLFCPLRTLTLRASSTFSHNFSGLVNLRLERICFDDVPTLVGMVCAFPCLQTLSIERATIYRIGFYEPPLTMFQPSPHLVALELDIIGLDKMLDWFLTLAVLPGFRSIRFIPWGNSRFDVVAIHKFIATLNESMEHLSLPIYSAYARSLVTYTRN